MCCTEKTGEGGGQRQRVQQHDGELPEDGRAGHAEPVRRAGALLALPAGRGQRHRQMHQRGGTLFRLGDHPIPPIVSGIFLL